MVTITNENLPGYDPRIFREFIRNLTKEWNLPQEYVKAAEIYICRRWTANQIDSIITGDGIKLGGIVFLPLFRKNAAEVLKEELTKPTGKQFWLSFRAIRYPLGSTNTNITPGAPDSLKAYVLIQVDDKS